MFGLKRRPPLLHTEVCKSDGTVRGQQTRNLRPHLVLANSVDFNLYVFSFLIKKRWYLENMR
jgi:hypothetical protein